MIKQIVTPLPEVVDRYTIARLKLERLDDTQIDVESMKEEIEYYKSGYQEETSLEFNRNANNEYVQPVRLVSKSLTRKTIANDKNIQYTFDIELSKTLKTQSI